MERVKLPPPDALPLAAAAGDIMPDTSPADWRELSLALVALATEVEKMSGGDDGTRPALLPKPR